MTAGVGAGGHNADFKVGGGAYIPFPRTRADRERSRWRGGHRCRGRTPLGLADGRRQV